MLADAITGRQIRGLWMADRGVYRIHRILNETRRHGVVAAPIVMGKETVFVTALGPAVERLASDEARRACLQAGRVRWLSTLSHPRANHEM
ncbi:MAG TPA: hypothetical protein VFI11_10795 [Anaerolineales bacterium]|nr:hypothetical protein [Anaerolineales bacterium]